MKKIQKIIDAVLLILVAGMLGYLVNTIYNDLDEKLLIIIMACFFGGVSLAYLFATLIGLYKKNRIYTVYDIKVGTKMTIRGFYFLPDQDDITQGYKVVRVKIDDDQYLVKIDSAVEINEVWLKTRDGLEIFKAAPPKDQ